MSTRIQTRYLNERIQTRYVNDIRMNPNLKQGETNTIMEDDKAQLRNDRKNRRDYHVARNAEHE